jgi:hypothetical protein
MIVSRPIRAQKDRKRALECVASGHIVTFLILSPTTMFHHLSFENDGMWVQKGGLFGKVDRTDRLFTISSRRKKAQLEKARVASQRDFKFEIGEKLT